MIPVIKDCLPLASVFPGTRERHLGRLCHVANNGYLLCLFDNGKVIGYAELYKVMDVPKYPAKQLPNTEENGKTLFVYALAVEADRPRAIWQMKQMARRIFNGCDSFAFHARDKNFKFYQERWN
jgi:hypothetical protein